VASEKPPPVSENRIDEVQVKYARDSHSFKSFSNMHSKENQESESNSYLFVRFSGDNL